MWFLSRWDGTWNARLNEGRMMSQVLDEREEQLHSVLLLQFMAYADTSKRHHAMLGLKCPYLN
jgi:protein kinase C-like protein